MREETPQKPEASAACRDCGISLSELTRHFCNDCLPELQQVKSGSFGDAGRAKLQEF